MKVEKKIMLSRILTLLTISFLLQSCSEVGLLKDSLMPQEIHHVTGFFVTYVILQLSILFVGLLLSIFLGSFGHTISIVAHFIWVVLYRDYGFLNVLLLFGLSTVINYVFYLLIGIIKGTRKP